MDHRFKISALAFALCNLLAASGAQVQKSEPAPSNQSVKSTKFNKPPDATFTINKTKTIKITTDGNPQPLISQSGLPADNGLTFSGKTGTLTGKPTRVGTYQVKFTAEDLPPLTLKVTVKEPATSTNASTAPCEEGTFTVRLRALQDKDADGLAQVLNVMFDGSAGFNGFFVVSAPAKPSKSSSGSNSSMPDSPSQDQSKQKPPAPKEYLCVYKRDIERTTGKQIPFIPVSASLQRVPADQLSLNTLIQKLDRAEFAGVGLDSRFIVPFAKISDEDLLSMVDTLPYPAPGFELSPADIIVNQPYRLLILHPATSETQLASKAGSDLAAQAAKIKHDLLALDVQVDRRSKEGPCEPPVDCDVIGKTKLPPLSFRDAEIALEKWDANHTVRLAALDPRNVAINLAYLFPGRDMQVFMKQGAVVIRPKSVNLSAPRGVLAASDAIERNVISDQSKAEKAWEQQLQLDAVNNKQGGSSNPAPQTTTTSNTTISTPPVGTAGAAATTQGKTPPPITIQTTTSTQTTTPESGANSQTPGQNSGTTANGGTSQSTGVTPSGGASPTAGIAASGSSESAKGAAIAAPSTQQLPPTGTVIRLFHLRQASNIATVVNAMVPGPSNAPLVQPLQDFGNDDLLLILPPAQGQPDRTQSIRRMIASLDEPRPAISLQVWSYLISANQEKKSDDHRGVLHNARHVEDAYSTFKKGIQDTDDQIQKALAVGLAVAINRTRGTGSFFDPDFKEYLTGKAQECMKSDQYCLGYDSALEFAPPFIPGLPNTDPTTPQAVISFNRYILLLAAAGDDQAGALVKNTVDNMDALYPGLKFSSLRAALTMLAQPPNLHLFRAALLDFLFQYKLSLAYANDFDPYYLQHSAQTLDGYLNNLITALNRDVDRYVDCRLKLAADAATGSAKQVGLANYGEVQVEMISGDPAAVSGTVNNYFNITQPALLKDMVSGLLSSAGGQGSGPSSSSGNSSGAGAGNGGGVGGPATPSTGSGSTAAGNALASASKLLTPWQAVALNALATASAPPQLMAQVNAQTTLAVTPISLDTASAAELHLSLQISNPTTTIDASKGAPSAFIRQDLANSVANYNVQTQVRVDSLKLFQVSSLSMDLTHRQTAVPVPVVGWAYEAIFGTVPWMNDHILAIQRHPLTVQNRSVAVVRAVVVPTAMDLGLSMPFRDDHLEDPLTWTSMVLSNPTETSNNFREFHKKLINCVLDAHSNHCMNNTKLSDILEQIHDSPH